MKPIIKIFISGLVAIAGLSLWTACQEKMPELIEVKGISIEPKSLSLFPNKTYQLNPVFTPKETNIKKLLWSSSDSKTVSVDNFGKLTTLKPGKAVITVKAANNQKATCEIVVTPYLVESVNLNKTELSLKAGATETLKAAITPSNASDKALMWESSNKDIATVDDKGAVTGVFPGEAHITVKTVDGGKTDVCAIKVTAPETPATTEVVSVWADNSKGYRAILGGDEPKEEGWLSYKDNVIIWKANTTGKPRKAEMTFANGSKITLTQFAPEDFKGSYKLLCKRFAKATAPYPSGSGTNAAVTPNIIFGEPLKGETLADVDGKTYTNNIGIRGLYLNGVMDAAVDIDYKNKKVRIGMFLDARKGAGQKHLNSQLSEHPYVCFLPAMGTTTDTNLWAAPWNFTQEDLSTKDSKDYTWLWFSVSDDFSTLNYNPNTAETIQHLNTDGATTANAICGITAAVSSSKDIIPEKVRKDWEMVYQGNKMDDNEGLTFIKN